MILVVAVAGATLTKSTNAIKRAPFRSPLPQTLTQESEGLNGDIHSDSDIGNPGTWSNVLIQSIRDWSASSVSLGNLGNIALRSPLIST